MKLKHALFFGLLAIQLNLFGQDLQQNFIYDDDVLREDFIEKNFEGGYEGYTNFFRENLIFPNSSYKNQVEGLILLSITINGAQKSVQTKFLTLLDEEIEKQLQSVISKSILKWKMTDGEYYTLYQPIIYSMLPFYAETLEGDIPEIPADLPLKFMPPFILVKAKRIPDNITVESLGDIEASETKKSFYLRLEDAYQKFLAKGDNESAYLVLNRLIRYNPLNRDYLISRIKLEQALGANRFQTYDSYLLSDFVDSEANRDKVPESNSNVMPGFAASDFVIDSITAINKAKNKRRQVYESYQGGRNHLTFDFFLRVTYPGLSQAQGTRGVAFLQFNIPPEGPVQMDMLTYLDDYIEQTIKTAASTASTKWIRRDTTYQAYISLVYSDIQAFDKAFREKDAAYQKLRFSDDYSTVSMKSFKPFIIDKTGLSDEAIATVLNEESKKLEKERDSLSKITSYEVYNQYLENQKEYRTLTSAGKGKKAFKVLSEMILYNPFEPFLIRERIRLAKEIKRDKYLAYDEKCLLALETLFGSAEERLSDMKENE